MSSCPIRHVDLDTGRETTCWREEIDDEALAVVHALLERALATRGYIEVPLAPPLGREGVQGASLGKLLRNCQRKLGSDLPSPVQPCTITARSYRGRALAVTVWGPLLEGQPVPLTTLGIAPTALASGELWEAMAASAAKCRERPPPPWCAARGHRFALPPATARWLEELGRHIAWAWTANSADGG